MKRNISLVLVSLLAALPVASSAAEFEDTARVIRVNEKTERINQPREECVTETVTTTQSAGSGERDIGGAVIGGLAGAILGSQVGKGNGKAAGAAVGAAAGAIVGDRVQNSGYSGPQTAQRCRQVDSWQTRSMGYEVTYEYQGRTYTETLPHQPGNTLRVRVNVTPQR